MDDNYCRICNCPKTEPARKMSCYAHGEPRYKGPKCKHCKREFTNHSQFICPKFEYDGE